MELTPCMVGMDAGKNVGLNFRTDIDEGLIRFKV